MKTPWQGKFILLSVQPNELDSVLEILSGRRTQYPILPNKECKVLIFARSTSILTCKKASQDIKK